MDSKSGGRHQQNTYTDAIPACREPKTAQFKAKPLIFHIQNSLCSKYWYNPYLTVGRTSGNIMDSLTGCKSELISIGLIILHCILPLNSSVVAMGSWGTGSKPHQIQYM
uniref:Uncharacterized protein n=1 Tax=Anguilla anguilla TaxID=7936 RepID=A0A0E9RF38_ANGAN